MPNKYVYLLNIEPSNLVFLKTFNTDFDDVIITFNKFILLLQKNVSRMNIWIIGKNSIKRHGLK